MWAPIVARVLYARFFCVSVAVEYGFRLYNGEAGMLSVSAVSTYVQSLADAVGFA